MASTFSLQGKLGLDARDFQKGAKQAEAAIGDVAEEIEALPDKSKQAGSDAGAGLGGGMMKGFAALGVGAAIGGVLMAGLSRAFAEDDAERILIGKFGKTADEAARYGKIGGDLYASNWGDSLQDVAEALGAVDQRLVQTGQIAESSLEGMTEKAMALATTFDEDVNAVVRSVSQLMLNDLAPNADVAFDLVTTGLQNGSNAAGDLFDTIDEYSQHFSAFGLSAEDMMSMFSDGMANGQRDTDKMADAVKEMFIRTTDGSDATRAAFDRIGLSTETMAAKITAGGDGARQAFIDILRRINVIEDPIDRTTTGVALMGTMFEDLGPKGVDSLLAIQNGLGDVEGATDGVVDSFVTTEAGLTSLKRRGEAAFAGIGNAAGEAIDSLMGAEPFWERLSNAADKLKEKGPASFEAAIEAVKPYVANMEEAEAAVAMYAESVDDSTAALLKQVPPQQAMVQGYIDEALEARKAADETNALADEVNALGGEASNTTSDIDRLTAEFDAMKSSLSDRSSFLSVMDSFEGMEAKGVEALAAVEAGAEDAAQKLRDYEQDQIKAKDAVIDYATEVGNIPPSTVTEINALIDQGKFAEAEARLAELEKARNVPVTITLSNGGRILMDGTIRLPGGQIAREKGGPVTAGGGYIVGERGPEWFQPNSDGHVFTAAQTAAMFAHSVAAPSPRPMPSGGSPTFANGSALTINHYGPNLSAADVSRGYTLARLAQVA